MLSLIREFVFCINFWLGVVPWRMFMPTSRRRGGMYVGSCTHIVWNGCIYSCMNRKHKWADELPLQDSASLCFLLSSIGAQHNLHSHFINDAEIKTSQPFDKLKVKKKWTLLIQLQEHCTQWKENRNHPTFHYAYIFSSNNLQDINKWSPSWKPGQKMFFMLFFSTGSRITL